jgi:putative transcriptional regulator
MNDEDFNGIAAGLKDAIAFVNGDSSRGRVVARIDVKAIRDRAGMTQPQFAAAYHIPVGTLRDWEQGRRIPDAPARALLTLIAADPASAAQTLATEPALA